MDAPVVGLQEEKNKQKPLYETKTEHVMDQQFQQTNQKQDAGVQEESEKDPGQKQMDPITEKIENVNALMPPETTQITTEQNEWKSSYSRAEAKLNQAKRWFDTNSKRMGKIKNVMSKLSELMSEQLPPDIANLQTELEKRYALYDLLVYYCRQYEDEKWCTITSIGRTRREIVKELAQSAEQEKEKLRAACQTMYDQKSIQKTSWIDVLREARAVPVSEVEEGYHFQEDTNDAASATARKSAAVYRMAAFLNMTDAVEEVRTATYEDAQTHEKKRGFLNKTDVHRTFAELKREIGEAKLSYDSKALYDLMRIRELDKLLQISRTDEDFSVRWTQENGVYVVQSVKAIHNGALVGTDTKQNANQYYTDRQVAYRLIAMPKEMLNGMFVDVLTKEERVRLEQSLFRRQSELMKNSMNYVQAEQYRSNAKLLLNHLNSEKSAAYITNKTEIHENVQIDVKQRMIHHTPLELLHPKENQELIALLTKQYWLRAVKSEQGLAFVAALQDWADLWKNVQQGQNRQNIIDQAKALYHSLIEWQKSLDDLKKGKSEEEWDNDEASIEELKCSTAFSRYCQAFGVERFPDDLTDVNMDQNMLDAEIELLTKIDLANHIRSSKGNEWKDLLSLKDRSDEPLFAHKPTASDVCQGYVGDCYLMSALMAIVEWNPQVITNMMIDQGDRVKVMFPEKDVVVSKKTLEYLDKRTGQKKDYAARGELWVQIMEKAYIAAGFPKKFKVNDLPNSHNEDIALMSEKDFWCSMTSLASGQSEVALENILGIQRELVATGVIHVNNMRGEKKADGGSTFPVYDVVWNVARQIDYKQVTAPAHWMKMKKSLMDMLKEPLAKELERRYALVDKAGTRHVMRALTLEDVQDTLNDIRGWRRLDGEMGYQDYIKKMESAGWKLTQEEFDNCIKLLAEALSFANDEPDLNVDFQHRPDLSATQPKYSNGAMTKWKLIKYACNFKVPLIASSMAGISELKDGLNGESVANGIVYGHAYEVSGFAERDNHLFVQLKNPWRKSVPQYGTVTDVNGKTHMVTTMNTDENTEGVFELDLNDFMQYFSSMRFMDLNYSMDLVYKKSGAGGNTFISYEQLEEMKKAQNAQNAQP